MKTKPLSIKTEFIIKTDRITALYICSMCESTIFEKVELNLSSKKHTILYSHVSFQMSTTIQKTSVKDISFEYIKRIESGFRNNLYSRLANCITKIVSVKEKTTVCFISDEYKLKHKK